MLRIIREEEAPSLLQRFSALGPDTAEIAARRGTDTVRLRKLLDGDLNWIVKKALEKSPQRRYASPSELAGDIERHLRGEPVLARPRRQAQRIRKSLVGAAAALVLIPAVWLIKRTLDSKPQSNITSTIVLSDVANDTGDLSFDSTFRQSISFELQRSPNLKVLSAARVAETLSQMRRTPGTRVSPEIAREICQRTASAAVIEGSLAKASFGYLLTLSARNCTAGDLVDEEQSQARSKDQVLNELRRLTMRLQSKSAVPLGVLQRNASPLEAATTSSLEALKSFTTARQRSYTNRTIALPLLKRAIELDREFALAHAWLGRTYADSGEQGLAMESIRQAYSLRSSVSDRENFFITYNYDRDVLRNFELCRQVCESWIDKYPGDMQPHAFLSGLTSKGTAQYEKSIVEGEKAVAMDPDFTVGYQNIAESYLFLNRPQEARGVFQRAAQRKLPSNDQLTVQFLIAFLNRDRSEMQRVSAQIATASPYGDSEYFGSLVSAYEGRLHQSRQACVQAVTLARQAHLAERAALFEGAAAIREALFGYPDESSRHVAAALQLARGRDADFPPAFALALCGKSSPALAMVMRLETEYPEDTCVRFSYSPAVRALLAIKQGRPEKAVEVLTASKAYELAQTGISLNLNYGGALYSTYVRGLAYRKLHKYSEAAAEFQRVLDHPGLLLADPIGPAARRQLARALRDAGEKVRAKAAYQNFLALWEDADPDIPLLQEAKADSARL
jgi:tetratricopeptide (TPR) repeat protein